MKLTKKAEKELEILKKKSKSAKESWKRRKCDVK